MNKAENAVVCMAIVLSSNSHITSNFDTVHLKISRHDLKSGQKYKNFENRFL